jgi:hypothetical protein
MSSNPNSSSFKINAVRWIDRESGQPFDTHPHAPRFEAASHRRRPSSPSEYRQHYNLPIPPNQPNSLDGFFDHPSHLTSEPDTYAQPASNTVTAHPSPDHNAPSSADNQASTLDTSSEPTEITRHLQREAAKQAAKQFKETRKARLKEEQRRKRWLGGVAWGFDPTAGSLPAPEDDRNNTRLAATTATKPRNGGDEDGAYVSAGRSLRNEALEAGVDEIDEVGRRTGRRWLRGNAWGVERGGPGKEGKFGHGSLRGEQKAVVGVKEGRVSPWKMNSGV